MVLTVYTGDSYLLIIVVPGGSYRLLVIPTVYWWFLPPTGGVPTAYWWFRLPNRVDRQVRKKKRRFQDSKTFHVPALALLGA